jgi:hypothetical protein
LGGRTGGDGKIFRFRKFLRPEEKGIPVRFRLAHSRETLPFLLKWKLRRMEGTLSLPDRMLNGILYAWLGTIDQSGPETESIVGDGIKAGEYTVLPVSKISLGIGAGAGREQIRNTGGSGGAGGGGSVLNPLLSLS